jgi:hypothetical protein
LALQRPDTGDDERRVRDDCGYGCIRCGCTIYQYRTIGGTAAPHDIILLCPPCAHALKDRPGAQTALRAMRDKPVTRMQFFDRRKLPYGTAMPDVEVVPGVVMRNTPVPVMFRGTPLIRLGPPEVPGGAIGMSIALGRASGVPMPLVIANQWQPDDDAPDWTFERPGNRYVVTSRDQSAKLILVIHTPQLLAIELLRTHAEGEMLEIDAGGTRVDGVFQATPASKSQLVGMAL